MGATAVRTVAAVTTGGASELARKVGQYVNSQEEIINNLSEKAEDKDGVSDDFSLGN